ncbi:MAG: isoprenylcysteine carboxylmethyltransferase family protein [Candidatus Korobacteraceae bacterium]|jgi:protein-S-isoprenylcysteine O-methyltransferase Ste14
MTLHSAIDIFALLVCSVYCTIPLFWLAIHPFIARWRNKGRRAYASILPIWAAFIAAAFLLAWPFRHAHYYTTWVPWIPAACLFWTGFSIYSAAFKSFDRTQVSGLAELEPTQHRQVLITTGIRSRVRHPIYLGHLCEVLGWCLGTGLIALYALAAFAIVTGTLMIALEDRELEARFGDLYRTYRRAVPAVIPRSIR